MYKVIEKFRDNDGKIYEVGEEYCNDNKERVEQLSTDKNKCNRPFIEQVKKTRSKKTEVEETE